MRTPQPLVLGMMLSLAAPAALAQTAAAAPREAPRAPRAPKAPRGPAAPEPPVPPVPPMSPEAHGSVGRAMRMGKPRARLGTQVSPMTSELRTFFGAPEDTGLLVQHVEPGSAAEAAKVQVGDVLVAVDGQRIVSAADVRDALADRSKGDVVEVVVVRNKKRKALEATLTAETGPIAFSIPPHPGHGFELPPAARRFMSPEAGAELERELEHMREQLREVERQLDAMHGSRRAPAPPAPPAPPRATPEGKRAKKK
jgi:hypothetical protein